MVEKWMQSKPNPYMNNREVRKVRVAHTPRKLSSFSKNVAAHYGVPIQLFKDSDKDGVMNVFDCKPHSKRKQDVIMPQNFGGGVSDMYARQEGARQQRDYLKQIREIQKQEEARMAELQKQGESQGLVWVETPTTSSKKYDMGPTDVEKASQAERNEYIADIRAGKIEGLKIVGSKIVATEKTGSFVAAPESSSGSSSSGSGSYVSGKGFVTSTGQTYPTKNPTFVPKGYTAVSPKTAAPKTVVVAPASSRGGSQSWQKTTPVMGYKK